MFDDPLMHKDDYITDNDEGRQPDKKQYKDRAKISPSKINIYQPPLVRR
jgi:hypothetical protein